MNILRLYIISIRKLSNNNYPVKKIDEQIDILLLSVSMKRIKNEFDIMF